MFCVAPPPSHPPHTHTCPPTTRPPQPRPHPQLTFLGDQLPYLVPTAREALRGMDRKPISDLVV
jgi:hypothetical protein